MANRFKTRLEHLRKTASQDNSQPVHKTERVINKDEHTIINHSKSSNKRPSSFSKMSTWKQVSPFVELCKYEAPLPIDFTEHIARDWSSVIPQSEIYFNQHGTINSSSLLFFDLETTGLSGGAGTVTFLAAFGSFIKQSDKQFAFSMRQYLLLDYEGEPEFLEALHCELIGNSIQAHSSSHPPYLVSYNGRAFDEQILHTRFLMNGLEFPSPPCHFDLLYPSRMLWKDRLENCAQKTIEAAVLGIDRGYDLPGEFAPFAWFEYLRTGNRTKLEETAAHNRKDIEGLAGIFFAINAILENPSASTTIFNKTRLGMKLTEEAKKFSLLQSSSRENDDALLAYGSLCLQKGREDEGITALNWLARSEKASSILRCEALRKLAIHAEWTKKDCREALAYTEQALELQFLTPDLKNDLEKRKARLKNKLT